MAKAKKNPPKKTVKKKASVKAAAPQEIKVKIELHIPQLDHLAGHNSSPTGRPRMSLVTERDAPGEAVAVLGITPVQAIHIVEATLNTVELVKDKDVAKDQAFTASNNIFPTLPLSLFMHITGITNTAVDVDLQLDGASEFKATLFIPNSGRLVIQKIIG